MQHHQTRRQNIHLSSILMSSSSMEMNKVSKQHDRFLHRRLKSQKPTKTKKKPVKITYISSPTMVKVNNASDFRAIVQELTGKDSKVVGDLDQHHHPSCSDLGTTKSNSSEDDLQAFTYESSPCLNMDSESFDGYFSHNTCSSAEMDDSSFWLNVSQSFFADQNLFV